MKAETKVTHTPGPWETQPTAGHDKHGQSVVYAETGGRGTDIAIVYDGDADANLIAAAPEMLNALEAAKEALRIAFHNNEWIQHDGYLETVEAAIQKARGGQ